MVQESWFAGVSGGHRRSTALVINGQGTALASANGEGLNLHTFQKDEVARRLDNLIARTAETLGLTRPDFCARLSRIALALPGAASAGDRDLAMSCVQSTQLADAQIEILDDTWAGLVAGTATASGVCAFAGTGASVFVGRGDFQGKPSKIDGWGPTIGDFGSAFQLATDMFRYFGRSWDRGIIPPLFGSVLKEFPKIRGITDVQNWFDRLYVTWPNLWRIEFAEIARVAVLEADRSQPDADATRLVRAAAAAMAESIEIALCRFDLEGSKLPIVFQGGMFRHSRLYRDVVAERVKPLSGGDVGLAPYGPVVGATLLSRASLDAELLSHTMSALADSVPTLPTTQRHLLLNDASGSCEDV